MDSNSSPPAFTTLRTRTPSNLTPQERAPMARAERFHFSHSRKIDSADRHVSAAAEAGVILQTAKGPNGRHVQVDGKRLLSFGSCSYMGLEMLPELRDSAHRAIDEYGTQF